MVVKNLPAFAGDAGDMGSVPGWEDPLRGKWQHTPVSLPGKSHGQRSLMGYSPWGCKQLDTTEWLSTHTPGDLHAGGLWTTLFKTILTSKPPITCNRLDFCSISSQPTSYVFADLYSNSYRDSVQQSEADFSLKSNLLQCQNYLACWTSLWQKCTLMTLLWRMLNLAWVVFCVMETPPLLLL